MWELKLFKTWMMDVFEIAFVPFSSNYFSENMGDINEVQGERFHQITSTMERIYQEK